jgi:hypothetical protein
MKELNMNQIYSNNQDMQFINDAYYDKQGANFHLIHLILFGFRKKIPQYQYHTSIYILLIRIAAAFVVLCCINNIYAQAPIDNSKPLTAQDLDRLIDSLANHNEQPRFQINSPIFAVNYDWNEQDRVVKVINFLIEHNSVDLFPRLIKNLDDKRYSLTCEINGHAFNMTIGYICWTVAYKNLLAPFRGSWPNRSEIINVISGGDKIYYPPPYPNLKEWYQARKDKPLWEMQIEIGEWAIKTIENSNEISEHDKSIGIRMTKEVIDMLRKTKKPIFIKQFGEIDYFNEHKAKEIREKYFISTPGNPAGNG